MQTVRYRVIKGKKSDTYSLCGLSVCANFQNRRILIGWCIPNSEQKKRKRHTDKTMRSRKETERYTVKSDSLFYAEYNTP